MPETPSCCTLPADAPFHTYEDVIRHLDGLGLFHVDMGLGRMKDALRTLGVEKLHMPVVQIVGTNGKGSTSVFLQAIARAHGLHVGIYNSPHMLLPEERIRMDARFLPRRVWPSLASQAVQARCGLTYFELLTVMAALAYQSSDCQLVILEAGLGGRYDATTAIHADLAVFAPIGLDHVNVLGSTVEAIADDKSDVLREGVAAAVSAPQPEDARAVIAAKAAAKGIPLLMGSAGNTAASASTTPEGSNGFHPSALSLPAELAALASVAHTAELGLHGPHQRVNAETAVNAWLVLCHRYGWNTDAKTIARGLADAFMPGRLQYVPAEGSAPAFWLDGAHNAHGMTALANALQAMPEEQKPGAVVFSCLADKDPEKLTAMLRGAIDSLPVFIPTIPDNPRAAAGADLAAMAGPQARPADTVAEALQRAADAAHGKPVLVCGSLYLLSEFYALNPSALHY